MNSRELFIVRAALIYMMSNLDDLNEAFEEESNQIIVNGDIGERIEEDELEQLIFKFQ